jgi:Spherulation-specific family 4
MVINTSNTAGGAGSTAQAVWTTQINALRSAGIIVLGYIDTAGGAELEATINSRTDAWKTNYPMIDGIFFDNIGILAANQTYNTNIANYAKVTRGFQTVAANCKVAATVVETTWHSQGVPIDTFVVYDGPGLDVIDISYTKFSALNNNQLAYWGHTAPVIDNAWTSQLAQYIGWIYYTPNTNYNTFPSNLGNLVRLLYDIRTGSGATGTATTDKWGIEKIYHDKVGGTQKFMNRDDIFNDPDIDNIEGEGVVKLANGHWSGDGGSNGWLRVEWWSPALASDAERLAARFHNIEITAYVRVQSQTGGPPYAGQLYSRGGHHGNPTSCEGSALKARFSRAENSVMFVKEICHSCYTGNRAEVAGGLASGHTFGDGDWYGWKHIIYNIVESGVTYTKQEIWVDPDCTGPGGELIIGNNWQFRTSNIDRGDWYCDSGRYSSDCGGCAYERNEILTEPGGGFTSGNEHFHRNLFALRSDEEMIHFDYVSGREIDPTKPVATTPGGGGTTSPTPPAPPGTGGGGGTTPPPEEPGEESPYDPFGVKKIFPTANNGDEFFMNMTNITANLNRFNPKLPTASALTKNADGTWKVRQSAGVSMQVYQKNGYDPVITGNAALDHAACHNRGFMQDSADFKNVECTVYVKLNTTTAIDDFFWLVRGGEHEKTEPNCEGCCLRIHLGSDGSSEMRKEQWHVNAVIVDRRNVLAQSLVGKWVGIKCVVINRVVNNAIITSQQLWVDVNNINDWVKIDERTDAGGWGSRGQICKGAPDQILTFGAPMVQFGWTTFSDVDVKWLSVREIDAAGVPMDPPPPDPIGSCAGV